MVERMAVDILESILETVAGRHQLDNAVARMSRDPGSFVEQLPAAEISFDITGQFEQEPLHPDVVHDAHHIVDADKGHET